MTIYTIGHSNITVDDFIRLLHKAGIEALVDVRSSPHSKYASQFNKEGLMNAVTANGIKYIFMGDLLGGRPKDESCYINGNPAYDLIRQKDFYKTGINRLLKGIAQYRIAIMCSEEDPMKCHRRNLIGADINKMDINVLHIRSNGVIEADAFYVGEKKLAQSLLF